MAGSLAARAPPMPRYVYECRRCGAGCEADRSITDRHTAPVCSACGGSTALAVSAALVVFRGGGWSTPTTVDKLRARNAAHTARGNAHPAGNTRPR